MNDLKMIKEISASHLIGVGESTHGTHEFFTGKISLFKELVCAYGFNTFMLEDRAAPCSLINQYTRTGKGNPEDLLKKLYAVWRVQELLELIEWLRKNYCEYPVTFVGFDIEQTSGNIKNRDRLMAENIANYMNANPGTKALVWAHNMHVKLSSQDKEFESMGMFLRESFGSDYTAIGQFFGIGDFNATHINEENPNSKDRTLRLVHVSKIPKSFVEYQLAKLSADPYYLNNEDIKSHSLDKAYPARSVGWGILPKYIDEYTDNCNLFKEYDGVIFYPSARSSSPI